MSCHYCCAHSSCPQPPTCGSTLLPNIHLLHFFFLRAHKLPSTIICSALCSTAKWVPYEVPLTTGRPQGHHTGSHSPSSPGGSCSCSAGGVVETAQLSEKQQKMHVSAPNPFPEDSLDGGREGMLLPVNGRGEDRGLSKKQVFSQGLSQRLLSFAPDFSQSRQSFLTFWGRGFF